MQVKRFMTISEYQNFCLQDEKKYEVNTNIELLRWLDEKTDEGYSAFLKIEKLQELIDFIALWYEIKFPNENWNFVRDDKVSELNPSSRNKLVSAMDCDQLMARLSDSLKSLIRGEYRGPIWSRTMHILSDDSITTEVKISCRVLNKAREEYRHKILDVHLSLDNMTGIIDSYPLGELRIPCKEVTTIDELLVYLEANQREDLEYSDIKKCVYNHMVDLELRNKVLNLVPLRLLYSKSTVPSMGYCRALQMIQDFNQYFKGLDLNSQEIDEIMSRDYSQKLEETHSLNEDSLVPISFWGKTGKLLEKLFPNRS